MRPRVHGNTGLVRSRDNRRRIAESLRARHQRIRIALALLAQYERDGFVIVPEVEQPCAR